MTSMKSYAQITNEKTCNSEKHVNSTLGKMTIMKSYA